MSLKTKQNYKLHYFTELRPIAKGRNKDGYENMSKKQLEDLFTKPQKI